MLFEWGDPLHPPSSLRGIIGILIFEARALHTRWLRTAQHT